MLELDSNNKYIFPGTAYNAGNYALLCVNTAFIPFFRRFFNEMQDSSHYSSRDDWWRSYQVFAEMEESLMSGSVQQLIDIQARTYRLLDTALNGTNYTATTNPTTHIITIAPDIPAVPPNVVGIAPGLRRQLLDLQGVINAGWFGIGGQPATIADIVNALRVGSAEKKTSLIDTLASILAAGSDVAQIFSLVENLLGDTVNGIEEGAIVAVLIASTMAQASIANAQAQQIQRLINSLDGGGQAPGDSILTALRGTTAAGADRNVIDASGGSGLVALLDQVEPLLTDIKAAVQ
jgi:hypothetical protein